MSLTQLTKKYKDEIEFKIILTNDYRYSTPNIFGIKSHGEDKLDIEILIFLHNFILIMVSYLMLYMIKVHLNLSLLLIYIL